MHWQSGRQRPGQPVWNPHSTLQVMTSHSGGGGTHDPFSQVLSAGQSATLQHCVAQTHVEPLLL